MILSYMGVIKDNIQILQHFYYSSRYEDQLFVNLENKVTPFVNSPSTQCTPVQIVRGEFLSLVDLQGLSCVLIRTTDERVNITLESNFYSTNLVILRGVPSSEYIYDTNNPLVLSNSEHTYSSLEPLFQEYFKTVYHFSLPTNEQVMIVLQ
jgi:hypothetical protein